MSCLQSLACFGGQTGLQFLMLGCEGAGKTTLLYKLKIDTWSKSEITKAMRQLREGVDNMEADVRDPSYHYEEFASSHLGSRYGVWDVPGSEPLVRMWPMFYRYLRIDALLYVVDCFSRDRESLDRIARARRQLHHLLNEHELRRAAVVLILNVRGTEFMGEAMSSEASDQLFRAQGVGEFFLNNEPTQDEQEMQKCFEEMLGVPEIKEAPPHRGRFFTHAFSCADIARDKEEWAHVLKDIRKVARNQVGEVSTPLSAPPRAR